jgi:uncharacterized protein YfaQ (DUF2300 family)
MNAAKIFSVAAAIALCVSAATVYAAEPGNGDMQNRFDYLSTHSNSSCSQSFMSSIAAMPADARLQGSCCSPMVLKRYVQQVLGLKAYAKVPQVPPDPYNIEAGLAAQMMAAYRIKLNDKEQAAYDYATQRSNEHGPCCCQCWRWRAYGGLATLLIRSRGFTGPQVTAIWNLSDGCGGSA